MSIPTIPTIPPIAPTLKLADIRIQNLQAERPELFQEPKNEKIDLREFQTKMYAEQRTARIEGSKLSARKKLLTFFRWKNRTRRTLALNCLIVDTGKNKANDKLYFELSNGQVVCANRFNTFTRLNENRINKKDLHRFESRRRKNEILHSIINQGVIYNASRELRLA